MAEFISNLSKTVSETPLSQFYQQHFNTWKRSGLSQAEYCRQNDLNRHRFGYWKRKLSKTENQVEFVMLPANLPEQGVPCTQSEMSSSLHLTVDSRLSLEIQDRFSPETLKKVLQVLEVL